MEAVTVEQVEQAQSEEQTEPAAKTTQRQMFKYSEYVHVGEGASECEHGEDGQCRDKGHFHAWIRLPNQFQHEDIRRKALAAKARKVRELRDPESNASVVLDMDLHPVNDPIFTGTVVDELVARDWADDYLEAQRDVEEREAFEHISQDREEFNRLKESQEELPEAEQSDEYRQLKKQMTSYVDALRAQVEETQRPKREELMARPIESLVGMVREARVQEEADKAFVDSYDAWMWFVGTYKVEPHQTLGRPHLPMWEDIGTRDRPQAGTMFAEDPGVVATLDAQFRELQFALQRASAGN